MNQLPTVPKSTTVGDVLHSTARAAVGLVPGGGAVLEFFRLVFTGPAERRREKWMHEVVEAIRYLTENRGVKVEDLLGDETFFTVVNKATQVAMRTHEEEKFEALRNYAIQMA